MFGKRLRALRTAKGLTQAELGRSLGVKKQTVSNWENENIMPGLDTFLQLVRCLNTTPNNLLGYEDKAGIDASGLSETEIVHIVMFADDLRARSKKE